MTLAAAMLADSPLGFWKLDETSGTTATDSSGNARHGTYSNGAMVGVGSGPCDIGGASPGFDLHKYVTVPSDAAWSLSTLSIEALFRIDPADTPFDFSLAIVSHDPNVTGLEPSGAYNLYAEDSFAGATGGATLENNNNGSLSGSLPCDIRGCWTHVVATHDSAASPKTRLYLKGIEVASGNVPNFETGTRGLFIGRRGIEATAYMFGNLSHVAVYGSVLSAARVAAHWAELDCPACCKPWNIGAIAI